MRLPIVLTHLDCGGRCLRRGQEWPCPGATGRDVRDRGRGWGQEQKEGSEALSVAPRHPAPQAPAHHLVAVMSSGHAPAGGPGWKAVCTPQCAFMCVCVCPWVMPCVPIHASFFLLTAFLNTNQVECSLPGLIRQLWHLPLRGRHKGERKCRWDIPHHTVQNCITRTQRNGSHLSLSWLLIPPGLQVLPSYHGP